MFLGDQSFLKGLNPTRKAGKKESQSFSLKVYPSTLVKGKLQAPVVQSIVSLTILLRGQPNTDIFVEKMRKAFALQKLLIFPTKNIGIFELLMFEILTKC